MEDKIKIHVICGSRSPLDSDDKFRKGIDGFEVHILLGDKKYKINDYSLEQFRVKEGNDY